jgi:beta-lactam-binding protein with PASTA domain
MGLYQAEEVLQQNGLTVGTVGVRYSNETAGTVVQTTPGVGTAVPAGSRVDLVIALQQ